MFYKYSDNLLQIVVFHIHIHILILSQEQAYQSIQLGKL